MLEDKCRVDRYTIVLSKVLEIFGTVRKDICFLLDEFAVEELEKNNKSETPITKRIEKILVALSIIFLALNLFFLREERRYYLMENDKVTYYLFAYLSVLVVVFFVSFFLLDAHFRLKKFGWIVETITESLYCMAFLCCLLISSPIIIANSILMRFFNFKLKITIFQLWIFVILLWKLEMLALALGFVADLSLMGVEYISKGSIIWNEPALAFLLFICLGYIAMDISDCAILLYIKYSEKGVIKKELKMYDKEAEKKREEEKLKKDLDDDIMCFKAFSHIVTILIFVSFVTISSFAPSIIFESGNKEIAALKDGFDTAAAFLPWIILVLDARKKWVNPRDTEV